MIKSNTRGNVLKLIPVLTLSLLLISCHKSTEETYNYMTGTLSMNLPSYIIAGETITLSVTGITAPTEGITYKWTTPGFSADSVFGQTAQITAPVTIGTYTVQVLARHADYTSSTQSRSTTVLNYNDGGSFEGLTKGANFITDSRDSKKYYYSKIGNLDWFTQNLNWAGVGHPYLDADAISYAYGRLYTWNEATGGVNRSGLGNGVKGICPQGWSVPTNEDWQDLAKNLNGGSSLPFDSNWTGLGSNVTLSAYMNSVSMWKYSPENLQKNMYNWTALPGGNAQSEYTRYRYLREYGFWWSGTQKDADNAFFRYIYFDNGDFPYSYTSKNDFAASVRCVRLSN